MAQDPTSLLPGVGGALFGDRGRQIGGAAQGAVRGAMEPAPSLWGRMGNALRGVMGGPEDERR